MTTIEKYFTRSKPATVGKIEIFGLCGTSGLKLKLAHTVRALRIVDLGWNCPEVRRGRRVHAYTPLEGFADLVFVKFDRGREGRTTVLREDGLHGSFEPIGREVPVGIPRSTKPRIGKNLTLETSQVPQPHRYFSHKINGFALMGSFSRKAQE